MIGVDLKDQFLHTYLLERKKMTKWFIKLFRRLLNATILNSMIICRANSLGIKIDHLKYRVDLVQALLVDHGVEARLYTSEWRIMTYLDLKEAGDNLDTLGNYINLTIGFSNKHGKSLWLNWTECRTTIKDATSKFENLRSMRNLVSQLTRRETVMHRKKRGLFNFMGQVSHSLFGILDSENEEFYNENISQLDEKQANLIHLSREQLVIVKSTLKSVNRTLHDVSRNELVLEKGLDEIKKFINHENGETKQKYTYTATLVTLNDHAIQIQSVGRGKE
jgi:hypothetical protein